MLIKKVQFTFIFFIGSLLIVNAQNNSIYYGAPSTRGAQLHVGKDGSYDIVLKQGKHDKLKHKKNEYLFLYDIGYENSGFKVTEDYSGTEKDSIAIHVFRQNLSSEYEDVYIGFITPGYYGLI